MLDPQRPCGARNMLECVKKINPAPKISADAIKVWQPGGRSRRLPSALMASVHVLWWTQYSTAWLTSYVKATEQNTTSSVMLGERTYSVSAIYYLKFVSDPLTSRAPFMASDPYVMLCYVMLSDPHISLS